MEVEVKGFDELVKKIHKLDDRMTRREVLKIQRKMATPMVTAFRNELPESGRSKKRFGTVYPSGTLKKSVAKETVPASKVGGNPQIVVRPSTKGKKGGYYRFMVVRKGTVLGSNKRGSRKGKNTVVQQARDKVYAMLGTPLTDRYQKNVTKYVQKQIDRLSK